MNMSITTAPKAVSVTPTSSQAGASNGASGSGFAGALLGAMNGTGDGSASGNAILPLGLIGLVGQSGTVQTDGQTDELMAMLANLVDQLGQLEQEDQLPDDVNDQLASMLAAFQEIMQQLIIVQPMSDTTDQGATIAMIDADAALDSQPGQTTVAALKMTLQQISETLTTNGDLLKSSPALSGKLQVVVQALNNQLQAAAGTTIEQPKAGNDENAAVAMNRDPKLEVAGKAPSQEATNQALTATVDNKRTAPVLRDPVWKFQVVKSDDANVSLESLSANVAPVLSGEEAAGTDSQPAWTLLHNDVKAGTVQPTQANVALPAQVPVQQFADQMQKFMVKQFLLTQGNGAMEAKLTLTPEHLGQVDIRIVMQNGQLTAQFMTDSVMARDMLENQMSQLRTSLNAQGLQVDRLEVVHQPSSSSTTSFLHQDQRQNGSAGNGNGSNNRNDGGTFEDPTGFEDELDRTTTLREAGYGSSLNVTA